MRRLLLPAVIALVLVAAAACGPDTKPAGPSTPKPGPTTPGAQVRHPA